MSSFFLEEHLVADLAYSQGEHGQHSRAENFSMYLGGAQPFALDEKGGE